MDNLTNAQKMETKYAKEKFAILFDAQNAVAKQLHQESKFLKLGRLPGMLLVDKTGIIRFAYYSDNMHDIPKNRDVLQILSKFTHTPPES